MIGEGGGLCGSRRVYGFGCQRQRCQLVALLLVQSHLNRTEDCLSVTLKVTGARAMRARKGLLDIVIGGILLSLRSSPSLWAAPSFPYLSQNASCPPQSHKLSTKFPRNLTWWCSTSSVGDKRMVSRARQLANIILRIEVLPLWALPIRRTFFFIIQGFLEDFEG